MSNNRITYDECFYQEALKKDQNSESYIFNMNKFENNKKCRNEFGLVGGTNISEINGNKTDLESVLKGLSNNSYCSINKYSPNNKVGIRGNAGNKKTDIDVTLNHLNSCQMINYNPIPLE